MSFSRVSISHFLTRLRGRDVFVYHCLPYMDHQKLEASTIYVNAKNYLEFKTVITERIQKNTPID